MNDSDFATSGIRKMIIQITGIDVFKIEQYQQGTSHITGNNAVIIHFGRASEPDVTYNVIMSQAEFNRLCASDLANFKAHFDKIASDAQENQ